MKTKLTLAALIALSAIANATPGQISPVTTPKPKHSAHVSTGHLWDRHAQTQHQTANVAHVHSQGSAPAGPPTFYAPGMK